MPRSLKFLITAPGKVILFGEHSVVYGKEALAAAINKRTSVIFETTSEINRIEFEFKNLNYQTVIETSAIEKYKQYLFNSADVNNLASHLLEQYTENNEHSCSLSKNNEDTLKCVLYLCFLAFSEQKISQSFKIIVDSELLIGGGTGSSASFSVCLAAAFYRYTQVLSNPVIKVDDTLTSEDYEIINQWAYNCDTIIHGKASGMDNSICTYGSVVKMLSRHNDDTDEMRKITKIENSVKLKILLINTGVSRNTSELVIKVAKLKNNEPHRVGGILEQMNEIVQSACEILKELKNAQSDEKKYKENFQRLEKLVTFNQELLVELGVSHKSLDNIVNIARKYNLAAKLTGAGGGGNAFTFVPPDFPCNQLENCIEELRNNGYIVDDIVVGDDGVNIRIL